MVQEFPENVAFLFIPRSGKFHKGEPVMRSLDRLVRTNEFSEMLPTCESSEQPQGKLESVKGPVAVNT